MEKIKGNKEIIILLIIVLYLYVMMVLGGCSSKPIGNRYFLNSDLDVALVCEDYKIEPFLELGKKGMTEVGEKLNMNPSVVLLNLNDDSRVINKKMNVAALDNNVIVILGGWLKDSVKVSCRELKARNFVVIDETLNENNVKSIMYENQEGAFLMGVIAGGETKSNKVGFVGGLNDEIGVKFLSGYASGVKAVNNKAYENLINYTNVRYTEDFKDANKAYIKAKNLYESGCDIIFHQCGAAGKGVFKAALETGNKAIGVDVDCAKFYPEYKNVIISSMIKKIDKSILDVCEEVKTGTFKSGIENLKKVGVGDGYIDYSEDTKENISKETFDKLNKYKMLVKEKVITVPSKIFEVAEFKI